MARQRFIWPSIWTDKRFGELGHAEQIMFIALWSLADDEGRIHADPKYLRAQVFPYGEYTASEVEAIRNRVVETMGNVCLYRPAGTDEDLIALLKWSEYQHPKYPKPSKLPPPLPEDSAKIPPTLPPRVGQDWVGLDREGQGFNTEEPALESRELQSLSEAIRNKDAGTDVMLTIFSIKLPPAAFATAREDLMEHYATVENDGAYVRSILDRMVDEGQYATKEVAA